MRSIFVPSIKITRYPSRWFLLFTSIMYNPILFSNNNSSTIIHAKDFLSKYEPLFKWKTSENILEIGCANGYITKNILYPFVENHLDHLMGVDIFEQAINFAKDTNDKPKLSFQTLDIINTDDCDNYVGRFDKIFGFYVFHAVHNPDLWSKNVFKMLKPDGKFFTTIVVSYPNFVNEVVSEQQADLSKPWSKYIRDLHYIFYDFGPKPTEKVKDILDKAGLITNILEVDSKTFEFKDFDVLNNTCISGNHFLNYIPKELHQDYIDDYMTKLLQRVTRKNGSYSFSFDVLAVLATKPNIS